MRDIIIWDVKEREREREREMRREMKREMGRDVCEHGRGRRAGKDVRGEEGELDKEKESG